MGKTTTLLATVGLIIALVGCSEYGPTGSADTAATGDNFALKTGVIVPDSVKGATLYLYCSNPSMQTVNVHRAIASWSDSTVTWNNFAGAFDSSVHGSLPANTPGWKTADVTSLVREWVGGTYPNHGLLLDQEVSIYPYGLFFSKENAFMQPYLTVVYGGLNGDTTEQFPVLADASIDESAPDYSLGLAEVLFTGWAADGGFENQSLLYFDLPIYSPPPPDDSGGIDEPSDSTNVDPNDSTVVEPEEPLDSACTHPWPWWNRHSGCGPRSDTDVITPLLPLWIGEPDGSMSVLIEDNCMAVRYLHRRDRIDVFPSFRPLISELLTAKLNVAAGADDSAIAETIAAVDAFLGSRALDSRKSLSPQDLRDLRSWRQMLQRYNVGEIGPGACDPELDNLADLGG